MGNYENLKQSITEVIRTNGNQEITGAVLQSTLLTIISTVGANATFAGIATPTTNPGTPDGSVFYLASESGTYTNFNAIELQDGLSVLMWNGSWSSQQIFSIDDEPTAGSDNLVKSGGVEKFTSHGWKQGYILNDGGIASGSDNSIYNAYYFPVVKDRKYNLSSQTDLLWSISLYDTNKVFIQSVNWFTEISNYIATQDGFIRLSIRKLDSSAFNSNEWIDFNPMVTESIPNANQLTIGARYANTFDTISNSTDRLTVKELLRMPVGSRIQCTLASGYNLNMIQKESIESENYVDSGWIDKRIIEFDVVYPYQSINIRKNDDSNFSDRSIVDMFHVDILNDSILGTVHSAPEVDDEPTAGSDNLVKSGGVYTKIGKTSVIIKDLKKTSTTLYINIPVDIRKGETYTLTFTRSLSWNSLTISTHDNTQYIQDIFQGSVNANTEKSVTFTATDDAKKIVFKDTKNDGAEYNISLFSQQVRLDLIENDIKSNIARIDSEAKDVFAFTTGTIVSRNANNDVVVTFTNATISATCNGVEYVKYGINETITITNDESKCIAFNISTKTLSKKPTSELVPTDVILLFALNKGRGIFGEIWTQQKINEHNNSIITLNGDIKDINNNIVKINSNIEDISDTDIDTSHTVEDEYDYNSSDFVQGATYNNTFPTISPVTGRVTLKNIFDIKRSDYDIISLYVESEDDIKFAVIQSDSPTAPVNATDSGWKEIGVNISINRRYFSINIKNSDDSVISPSDLSALTLVLVGHGFKKTVKIGDKDIASFAAADNFLNRKCISVANHASNNPAFYGNTLLSTIMSKQNGYDVVENDVRMTSDNVPVLFHDNAVTIGGVEVAIEAATYAQLQAYTYPDGQKIATLEEQLKICKQQNLCLVNEFKSSSNSDQWVDEHWTDEKIGIVLSLLNKYLGHSNYVISAFSYHLLDRIRVMDAKATLMYVTYRNGYKPNLDNLARWKGNSWLYLDYGASVDANDKYSYRDYIASAISKGIPISCWTPTVLDCMRIVNDNYTKAIISNFYVDKPLPNVLYTYGSKNTFVTDARVTHNGTLISGGFLKLEIGEYIEFTTGDLYSGNDIIDFTFKGKLNITSLDHGYGQDITEYPNGILHPDGTIFTDGTYKYGITIGRGRYSNQSIKFIAVEETVIYKFNVIESSMN